MPTEVLVMCKACGRPQQAASPHEVIPHVWDAPAVSVEKRRSVATSMRAGHCSPLPRRSMRPFSRQSVVPVMRIASGRPMNPGSCTPLARPEPLSSTVALTSPPTGPGCTFNSNGPSRITPRSAGALISRLWTTRSPVTLLAGARSTGHVTDTERSFVRTT